MQHRRHIVFDLDGTLIDSKYEIRKTYRLVFQHIVPHGFVDPENLNYGATIQDVLKHVYRDDAVAANRAKLLFSDLYDKSEYDDTNLYPHVVEILDHLKKKDWNLYISTNKRFVPTTRILKKKGLDRFFSGVQANEMEPNVTVSKQEMVSRLMSQHLFTAGLMVGDTRGDIEAGKANGLVTVAATYGYENRNIFASLNPTYTIDSFIELAKIIENEAKRDI